MNECLKISAYFSNFHELDVSLKSQIVHIKAQSSPQNDFNLKP